MHRVAVLVTIELLAGCPSGEPPVLSGLDSDPLAPRDDLRRVLLVMNFFLDTKTAPAAGNAPVGGPCVVPSWCGEQGSSGAHV